MWSELKTLFWLQWKLTRAMFRSRRTSTQLRLVGLLFRLVSLLVTFPMFLLMGIGLAVGLILLSPRAAFEVVMIVCPPPIAPNWWSALRCRGCSPTPSASAPSSWAAR